MTATASDDGSVAQVEYSNPGNWIAVSRDLRDHPLVGAGKPVKPADCRRQAWSRMEAWIDLLCLAQYKAARIINKGEVQILGVGQLMGARSFLAARWNWTDKTVRHFLNVLEANGMISISHPSVARMDEKRGQRKSNKCAVITVCNYGKYRHQKTTNVPSFDSAKGPAEVQQRTTNWPGKDQSLKGNWE